uniref:Uncharacterized protein n=1 Tax=Anguilla anguilla TaxID=7936 RepID=A0A0E9R3T5_ANGAN
MQIIKLAVTSLPFFRFHRIEAI